jgi:sodium-dependent dicarboxylate transporter 2/3/5
LGSLTTIGMTGITELASNVSSVQMSMPLLAGAAPQVPCDPRLLMIPATMAASCGFMLPVGTPPNAVVFASGRIPMRKMALAGLVVDLVSIVLIVTIVLALGEPIMGIVPDGCPDWAQPR